MLTIGITGGTGFVGRHICQLLVQQGYRLVIFTRDMTRKSKHEKIKYSFWDPHAKKGDLLQFKNLDAVIHLAGAGVADKRWTAKRKQEILTSRVEGTQFLVDQLAHAPKCKTLIAASAIGYYGPDRPGKIPFREDAEHYPDFLGSTSYQWEQTSVKASALMRTVIFRMGIILGRDDGAFPRLAKPQSFGLMPILGSGRQIVSWIHIDDVCSMLLHAIQDTSFRDVYNAVAPAPVSHKEIMKTIGREKGGIKMPVHVPGALLKAGLGGVASELLKSCTVSSEKLQQTSFQFQYPEIQQAVRAILR